MATTKSRSYCLSNHISVLVDPSSVRNIKTPPFPSAHPHIPYLPFPSLSRLKRLGAGLVMFTVHADTSMKSEGGPGSAWTRRLWCLFTIYSWCTGLSHWIRAPVGDEFHPTSSAVSSHDGQWCSQTWAGITSLSPVGKDDSLSFITVRQILKLWSSLHGHISNPSIITRLQRWPTPVSSAVPEYLQAQTLTFSMMKPDAFRSSPLMFQPWWFGWYRSLPTMKGLGGGLRPWASTML